MGTTTFITLPYVVEQPDGLDAPVGHLGAVHKVPAYATEGRVAIVEHTLPPRRLGAPMHRHSREDELSYVLSGKLGAKLGDDVVVVGEGSYVLKPRGQWHTFWNAGDTQLRFMELVIPGGFDAYFQWLAELIAKGNADPANMRALAAEYGLEIDFDSVPGLCKRFGLTFK